MHFKLQVCSPWISLAEMWPNSSLIVYPTKAGLQILILLFISKLWLILLTGDGKSFSSLNRFACKNIKTNVHSRKLRHGFWENLKK